MNIKSGSLRVNNYIHSPIDAKLSERTQKGN